MDEDSSVVLYRATTAIGTSAIGATGEEQQLSCQPDDILEVYVPASSVNTGGGVAPVWYRATNRRSGKAGYVQCKYTLFTVLR